MRGRRLGAQPRGVRGDPPQRARPGAGAAERQPALLTDTVLETDRLVLRRLRPDDAATLRRWHADPRYMEHLGGEPTDDPADTDEALARWAAHWERRGFGLLAVEHRGTGTLVARGGPQYHRSWPDDPEVGWAVDPEWWGQGIATELGGACVAWVLGPLGFPRAVSITTEANVASRRVMAKLGFSLLTTVRDPVSAAELWVHSLEASLD